MKISPAHRKELEAICPPAKAADIILIGDGSGQKLDQPSGWACAAIERDDSVRFFHGAMNTGTNQVAELMPYLQALAYYRGRQAKEPVGRIVRVAVISDSEYAVSLGKGKYKAGETTGLWMHLMSALEMEGFCVSWTWARRSELLLNRWADWASRESRIKLTEGVSPTAYRDKKPRQTAATR